MTRTPLVRNANGPAGVTTHRSLPGGPTRPRHRPGFVRGAGAHVPTSYAKSADAGPSPAPVMRASCLAAERYWDQARWAIGAYAWRFDGLERAPRAGGTA